MIVWKIVDSKGSSIVAYGRYKLLYELGKETTARIGGCLCFSTLKKAVRFRSYHRYEQIYKCSAREPLPLPECGPHVFLHASADHTSSIWNGEHVTDIPSPWPPGTVAYKHVKPLEVAEV